MKIVIIGAGGHARSVYECLRSNNNLETVAFIDNVYGDGSEIIMNIPVLGPHTVVPNLIKNGVKGFIVGVGDNKIRSTHFKKFIDMGLEPINAIHPTANIASNVKLGRGICVGIGSTINTEAIIGENAIINTGAIIEHEVVIGSNVHIATGTLVAGRVKIKNNSFIGAGCVVIPALTIAENVIVGAGSIVLNDLPDNVVAVGSPAIIKKKNNN